MMTDSKNGGQFWQPWHLVPLIWCAFLGLEVASEGQRSCFLRCSEKNFVALFKGEKSAMNHYCYSIEDYDAKEAVEKLTEAGLKPRRSGKRVYFDDPDGLEVQIASKSHGV